MKIACFELEEWEKEPLQEAFSDHELLLFDAPLAEQHVDQLEGVEGLCVFIYSEVSRDILDQLPDVKLVVTRSTGYDHIDLGVCQHRGITVCNVPTYGENTVAEHTFALLLAISRKIPKAVEQTQKGDFSLDGLRGFDLQGKVMGVVGTGHIGTHVIRIAKGFGMKVVAFDPYPNKNLARGIGFDYVDFTALLEQSDVVSFHCPLTDDTQHLLHIDNIGHLKEGVVILNTARGGLIETAALIQGLEEGRIAYAGLDVLEDECFIKEERELLSTAFQKQCDLEVILQEHMLLEQENVLVTPHNAFNSHEALQRILDTTIENIKKFIDGHPDNVVQ